MPTLTPISPPLYTKKLIKLSPESPSNDNNPVSSASKQQDGQDGGSRSVGAPRTFGHLIQPTDSFDTTVDVALASLSDQFSSLSTNLPTLFTTTTSHTTPTRRRPNTTTTTTSLSDSPDTTRTPTTGSIDSTLPSKRDQVHQFRSILQQKKDTLFQLVHKKSKQDEMIHTLKQQAIHLQMQIKDESYNAGKQLIQLHASEQQQQEHQQSSLLVVGEQLFHDGAISSLEREFINVNDSFLKRFYKLPEGLMTNVSTTSSMSYTNNDQKQFDFFWVDPVQVGYLKKSVIDSRMSIMRLEKQMTYLKDLCEQVAKSLREDLDDVQQHNLDVQKEYTHQVHQLEQDRQDIQGTLAYRVACKEQELGLLLSQVVEKKEQNKELRKAVSTCQTHMASLEYDMQHQLSILQEDRQRMERNHQNDLRAKDREIKYLQRSMDDMNAQYLESGLVLSNVHIQRLLTLQNSTFGTTGTTTTTTTTTTTDGDNKASEKEEEVVVDYTKMLDLNSIFQCGSSSDMIVVQENKTTTIPLLNNDTNNCSNSKDDNNRCWRPIHCKLSHVSQLLALLPLFPDQLALLFSNAIKTLNCILDQDMSVRSSSSSSSSTGSHHYKEELGYLRGTMSTMLKSYNLDESIHSLAGKVMMSNLKAVQQKKVDKMTHGLRIDTNNNKMLQDLATFEYKKSNKNSSSVWKLKQRSTRRKEISSSSSSSSCQLKYFDFRNTNATPENINPSDVWSVAAVNNTSIAVAADQLDNNNDNSNNNHIEALYCNRFGVTILL